MRLEVQQVDNAYTFTLDADVGEEYRARLFVNYDGFLSYTGLSGCGVSCIDIHCLCDDWHSSFRPPRIDSHCFNTEIDIGLQNGENVFELSDSVLPNSDSAINASVNPSNVLIERKVGVAGINRILANAHEVYIELDRADIVSGTSVTIDNVTYTGNHLLGPDGLRLCGNYRIYQISGTVYKFYTEHYVDLSDGVQFDGEGYTLSIWEACFYEYSSVELEHISLEQVKFSLGLLDNPLQPGDYVYLGEQRCKVVSVDGIYVVVNAVLDADITSIVVRYSPHTPSAAIGVNWPSVGLLRTSSLEISNAPVYDHTENTEIINPLVDACFSRNGKLSNTALYLVCSGEPNETIVCMQFAPNAIMASDTSAAYLTMYLDKMQYSEATVMLYQMDSAGWSATMPYDEIIQHITGIPIGMATLKNPAMRHVNESDNIGDYPASVDNYNKPVTIQLDSAVISEWLTGSASYIPSFAIRVIGSGSPVIEFCSNEYGNTEKRPYILLSGGSSFASPELFDITLSTQSIEPGQILRLMPTDLDAHSFGNSIYSNEVHVGNAVVPIVSGSSNFIDVEIPHDLNGSYDVIVYRALSNGELIQLTEGASVYVNGDVTQRSVKLAKKLKPGIIDGSKLGSTALYNRDMGFSNMTEVTDETSLIQNVYSILLTNPGERLFDQNFGTGIEQKLFTLNSSDEGLALIQECIQQVKKYEPRVYIDGDQSVCEFDASENAYFLLLCVVLPTARAEMIRLPFKNRGTVV